jgi:hypothetical protein
MTQARATVRRNSFLIADDDDVRLELVVCNESGPEIPPLAFVFCAFVNRVS